VLEGREHTLGKEHPKTLDSVNLLAYCLWLKKGDTAGAEPLLRRALEARERTLGKEHPDTLRSEDDLAFFLFYKRDYAEAEPLFRDVLALKRKAWPTEPGRWADDATTLAQVLILIRFQDDPNSGRVSAWQDHAGLIH
jgi:hypothetical protein